MVATGKRRGEDGGDKEAPSNDNAPFDAKAWRKAYMKIYMQKRRARKRAEKEAKSTGL